jgi:hypothetical protein
VKRLEEEERERRRSGEAKPDEAASGNDRLSGGRSCRESNSTDLKPPVRPAGAKEEEVAKQEASGESAAASKESSDVRSSCRRGGRPGKTASGAEEEEASPPAQSPSALLDAVAGKLAPVMERLREHEVEVPVITALLSVFFSPARR